MIVDLYMLIFYLVSQQIELIVDLLGTPSVKEISEITTGKSGDIVFKFGKKKAKNMQQVFPEASPDGNI